MTVKEELTSVGSAQSDEPEVEEDLTGAAWEGIASDEAEDLPESATTVDD